MKRLILPSLILLALTATACQSSGRLGKAKSLWRNGEPEALRNARLAARSAPPEKAVEAALLVCKISLEVGNPKEALSDYEFYIQRLKRHDRATLRSVARLVFIDALNSWSLPRRCHALRQLRHLPRSEFSRALIQRAVRDPAPEVRAAAVEALAYTKADFFDLMLGELSNDSHPLPKAALLKVQRQRQQFALQAAKAQENTLSPKELARIAVQGSSFETRSEALDQLVSLGEGKRLGVPLWPKLESALKLRLARALEKEGTASLWSRLESDYASDYLFRSLFGLHPESRHNLRQMESLGLMAASGSSRARTLLEESLVTEKDLDLLIPLHEAARVSELSTLADVVARHAQSPDPELRSHALFALESLAKERALSLAKRRYQKDPDPLVRCSAFLVFDRLEHPPTSAIVQAVIADPAALAGAACDRLRERGQEGLSALVQLLGQSSNVLRREATRALDSLNEKNAVKALQDRFENGDAVERRRVLPCLSKHSLREFLNDYVGLLRNGDGALDLDAATAILNLDRAPGRSNPNPGP